MTTMAPPGTEIWKCKIYDLPTDNWQQVNRAESVQSAGMHHMDVMALQFTGIDIPPGDYDCQDLYDETPELMEGLIVYASQAETQTIQLPEGVIANFPPAIRVMHEIHYVNTSDVEQEVFSYINAYNIHPSEVVGEIWGEAVRDTNLNIPPGDHSEWTRCVMNEDVDLIMMSSHTHQLGRKVEVRLFDGTNVADEVIYTNTDWETPFLKDFGPPIHLPAGTGFEFKCDFKNDTGSTVTWGFSAGDEMCQVGIVFTPGQATRTCQPVASSDGML
jgi:hypothetical protein